MRERRYSPEEVERVMRRWPHLCYVLWCAVVNDAKRDALRGDFSLMSALTASFHPHIAVVGILLDHIHGVKNNTKALRNAWQFRRKLIECHDNPLLQRSWALSPLRWRRSMLDIVEVIPRWPRLIKTIAKDIIAGQQAGAVPTDLKTSNPKLIAAGAILQWYRGELPYTFFEKVLGRRRWPEIKAIQVPPIDWKKELQRTGLN